MILLFEQGENMNLLFEHEIFLKDLFSFDDIAESVNVNKIRGEVAAFATNGRTKKRTNLPFWYTWYTHA